MWSCSTGVETERKGAAGRATFGGCGHGNLGPPTATIRTSLACGNHESDGLRRYCQGSLKSAGQGGTALARVA